MATVEVHDTLDLERLIEKARRMDKLLLSAVKKGSAPVAKAARANAPVGDPSHHPEKKPLKKTITTVTRRYQDGKLIIAYTGPRDEEGKHGLWVEEGHDIVPRGAEGESNEGGTSTARVEGKKWFAPAVDVNRRNSEQITEDEIARGLAEMSK